MRKHKYCNTASGYDLVAKDVWWQHSAFPLVPMIDWQEADEWNAESWSFSWLVFRVWSLSHFALELAVEVETTGLNIKVIIPYVRIVIRVIPLPDGWLCKLQRGPR